MVLYFGCTLDFVLAMSFDSDQFRIRARLHGMVDLRNWEDSRANATNTLLA